MKIWIATMDDDNGSDSKLLFSAAEANEFARDWVRHYVSTGTREDITAENWPTFYDRLQDRPGFMDHLHVEDYDLLDHPVMAEVRGVIDGLMTQIDQMRGMFDDADGTIQAAVDDADTLLEKLDPHQGKATQTEAMGQIVTDTMARHGQTVTITGADGWIEEKPAADLLTREEVAAAFAAAEAAVAKWREDHPHIIAMWRAFDRK